MELIEVKAKIGGTNHPKYGALVEGKTYMIEEKDFGGQIFARINRKPGKKASVEAKKKAPAPGQSQNFQKNNDNKEE